MVAKALKMETSSETSRPVVHMVMHLDDVLASMQNYQNYDNYDLRPPPYLVQCSIYSAKGHQQRRNRPQKPSHPGHLARPRKGAFSLVQTPTHGSSILK